MGKEDDTRAAKTGKTREGVEQKGHFRRQNIGICHLETTGALTIKSTSTAGGNGRTRTVGSAMLSVKKNAGFMSGTEISRRQMRRTSITRIPTGTEQSEDSK